MHACIAIGQWGHGCRILHLLLCLHFPPVPFSLRQASHGPLPLTSPFRDSFRSLTNSFEVYQITLRAKLWQFPCHVRVKFFCQVGLFWRPFWILLLFSLNWVQHHRKVLLIDWLIDWFFDWLIDFFDWSNNWLVNSWLDVWWLMLVDR